MAPAPPGELRVEAMLLLKEGSILHAIRKQSLPTSPGNYNKASGSENLKSG